MVSKRIVPAALILLLLVLQAQLWLGRGSLPNVSQMANELKTKRVNNAQAQRINDRLSEEVRDLKEGLGTIEEKARLELSMVKPNEIYVQFAK
jgi:cell division protein FtsB